jgi:hypothetical protein
MNLRTILRRINSLPIKLTVRHYYPLGLQSEQASGMRLDSPEAWDALRRSHPHFETPSTRSDWIESLLEPRDGQGKGLPVRAHDVAGILRRKGITSLHSVGVGSAGLEYFILQEMPSVSMSISEYNGVSVARLSTVFPEGKPKKFDVMRDSWDGDAKDPLHAVLMYRLDPQLTDRQWREVFVRMSRAGVHNILYIPANFLTIRYILRERNRSISALLQGVKTSFAGYVRTQKVFESYWSGIYEQEIVTIGGKPSYFLSLRRE